MNDDDSEDRQEQDWEALYEAILAELEKHGTHGFDASADFFLVDENWGGLQQKIEVSNLNLLRPNIIKSLQLLLNGYPGWEIMIGVGPPEGKWPVMGLTIRAHEIVDGLQRQFFPKEFQDIRYEGSRPGTEND
jgi:hypothetical protein